MLFKYYNMQPTKPSFFFILRSRLQGKSFLYEFYFKGKKTLDVGCGEGEFLRLGKDHLVGVDSNARVAEKLSQEGFKVKQGSATALPFEDHTFDAVHCRNVIEHLEIGDAYKLLAEAARVLKPGGTFVLASETVTKKFWETFGHVKPYPPKAIIKLLRDESREEFEKLEGFEYVDTLYFGDYFKNKVAYLLSVFIAYHLPFFRREYFLILKKK